MCCNRVAGYPAIFHGLYDCAKVCRCGGARSDTHEPLRHGCFRIGVRVPEFQTVRFIAGVHKTHTPDYLGNREVFPVDGVAPSRDEVPQKLKDVRIIRPLGRHEFVCDV